MPTLGAIGMASYADLPDYDKMGPFLVRTGVLEPLVRLDWLLLDFGRRTADLDSASQTLLAANLQFNRQQQSVIFAVQKAYFALDAGRARVTARETALKAAAAAEQATGIRSRSGLASVTDALLARQVVLQQQFDIASARRDVHAAEATARAGDRHLAGFPAAGRVALFPAAAGRAAGVGGFICYSRPSPTRPDLAAKFADVEGARERSSIEHVPTTCPSYRQTAHLGRVYRQLDSLNLGPNGTTF